MATLDNTGAGPFDSACRQSSRAVACVAVRSRVARSAVVRPLIVASWLVLGVAYPASLGRSPVPGGRDGAGVTEVTGAAPLDALSVPGVNRHRGVRVGSPIHRGVRKLMSGVAAARRQRVVAVTAVTVAPGPAPMVAAFVAGRPSSRIVSTNADDFSAISVPASPAASDGKNAQSRPQVLFLHRRVRTASRSPQQAASDRMHPRLKLAISSEARRQHASKT